MQIANPGHVPSVMISSWIHSCMYYFSSHIRSLIFLGTCTVLICTLWTACLLVRISYVHWQNRFYSNEEKLVGCTLISWVPVIAVFGILFGAPVGPAVVGRRGPPVAAAAAAPPRTRAPPDRILR